MVTNNNYYISGYPSLAAFIASDRDKSTLIFKRFDRLAARNLLHLQSELARLQCKLDSMDAEDAKDDGDRDQMMRNKQCLRNWDDFMIAVGECPQQRERLELAERIKNVLKDYSMSIQDCQRDYRLICYRRGSPV